MATLLAKQARGPGLITSPNVTIPTGALNRSVTVQAVLDPADLADSGLQLSYGVDISTDGGVTWNTEAVGTWSGGLIGSKGPFAGVAIPPYLQFSSPGIVGSLGRLWINLPKSLNIGATGTVA